MPSERVYCVRKFECPLKDRWEVCVWAGVGGWGGGGGGAGEGVGG